MNRVVLSPSAATFASKQTDGLVKRCANSITRRASRNAPGGPYSTGTLKKSIHREPGPIDDGGITYRVGSDLIYAYSVHEGQPARTITAHNAPMLRFFWRRTGQVETFRSVQHPGTKAQPYLTSAMRQVAPRYGFRTITYR